MKGLELLITNGWQVRIYADDPNFNGGGEHGNIAFHAVYGDASFTIQRPMPSTVEELLIDVDLFILDCGVHSLHQKLSCESKRGATSLLSD